MFEKLGSLDKHDEAWNKLAGFVNADSASELVSIGTEKKQRSTLLNSYVLTNHFKFKNHGVK